MIQIIKKPTTPAKPPPNETIPEPEPEPQQS